MRVWARGAQWGVGQSPTDKVVNGCPQRLYPWGSAPTPLGPAAPDPLYAESLMLTQSQYPYTLLIPTRGMDNDVYGHVNNVVYYSYFDTVINTYLIKNAGLDIHAQSRIGLCAESHCSFRAALVFPQTITAGLCVEKLGTSSVRYGIGLFGADPESPAATGWFVHVFVDGATRRSVPIDGQLRDALKTLLIDPN